MVKDIPEELRNRKKTEKDFFTSVENLCKLYGICVDRCDSAPYPQNIAITLKALNEKLGAIDQEIALRLMAWEGKMASLVTVKKYDTGMTLFYLPVEPLHRLLQNRERKAAAQLLLSVCAYLYQTAGVSYHTEDSSYLSYIYTMVEEWNLEPECFEQEGEQEIFFREISYIRKSGEQLLSKISDPRHLKALKKRCDKFQPLGETEEKLKDIAERVCRLMVDYPDRSIMDSIYSGAFALDSDGDGLIGADQYISFFWSSSDCLYDQLMDSVNAELNEIGLIDEPVSVQFFDTPQPAISHDLSFERYFFDLLHEISDNLNSFEYEKHHTITEQDLSAV
ncbi:MULTISPECIES: hypothetical protein [unclassified Pedobacter]|uniref:hypothetical protein n=1 Tax=unclassified Pedobacter TaxID=2628915 RepID=UPI001E556A39|nr:MULTISPECIES: hypothetical protein [unclassified Pedobacter]